MSSPLRQRFLDAMSRVAATVNVVTTDGSSGLFGVTVSAMASVSADAEHPILLVCVNKSSVSAEPIRNNGVFCVNILRDDQSYISDRFAGRDGASGAGKFNNIKWTAGKTGAPRVDDCLVAFDCRVLSIEIMESHYVIFGTVVDVSMDRVGAPLIYSNRSYGTPLYLRSLPERDVSLETLKLGVFHTLGPYVLPRVLERLVGDGRSIDLRIIEGDQRLISENFKSGGIEAALIYDWDLGADIEKVRLSAFNPYALVSERHALASAGAARLAELAAEPLILLDAPPSGEFFLSLFRERGLEPTVRYRTSSMEMVRGMVGHGLGYSILVTQPATDRTYDGQPIKVVRLTDDIPPRHLVLAWRRDRPKNRIVENLLASCRAVFR
ncbi:flavin reductase [Afipia sp. Root123D2]|uniref:flavin reductase n=1 Tax=Afipia sp. Root123D2 TaxID=1736436 RepID=UPI0009E90845|nr:flavin reductase [Afipia sp. Root123D2]